MPRAVWLPDPAQTAAALGYGVPVPTYYAGSLGTQWHGMGRKRGRFRDPFCGRFCDPILHTMGLLRLVPT